MFPLCYNLVVEARGLRSTDWSLQNSHGDVGNSTGNRVAKEHIHMTHGQRVGIA